MRILDGHNDTLTRLYQAGGGTRAFFEGDESGHVDLPRAQQGGLAGGFFAIFTSPPPDSPERDPMHGLTFTENGFAVTERSAIEQGYAQAYTDAVLDFAYQIEAESSGSVRIVRDAAGLEDCLNGDGLGMILALEGAEHQIRVNTVNPDAVLRGSKIWTGEWREQRAAAYSMQPDELEEHYRKRSMLKRSVFPEDIAEAVYFLASDMSAKSTGNIINVDAGNAQSFTR